MNSLRDNDDVLDPVRAVFAGRQDALGLPDAPTKAGLLALARVGLEAWNAWRAFWPEPVSDFGNVDFREAEIDFSGFLFGSDANFTGAQFGDEAKFEGAQFGDEANFSAARFAGFACFNGARFDFQASFFGVQFDGGGDFNDAQFGMLASFNGAKFGDVVSFDGAQFGDDVNFDGAQFGHEAHFFGVQFGDRATFNGTQFSDKAYFVAAQFGEEANFSDARFGKLAWFNGAQFGDVVSFDGAHFCAMADFAAWTGKQIEGYWRRRDVDEGADESRIKRAGKLDLRSDAFRSIFFLGVQFSGDVSFQNREFLATTNFGPVGTESNVRSGYGHVRTVLLKGQPARFHGVPNFHGCKLHQDTSFYRAQFLAPASEDAARAYRTLKLAMAQQHAIRQEQFFFHLEMMTEAALQGDARRRLFKAYEKLSDYGFSLRRPFCFWLLCVIVFGLAHGALANWSEVGNLLGTKVDWSRTMQWARYILFNAIPVPGFDSAQRELRNTLFGTGDGVLLAATALDMLHKSCALVAVFLAALALRNLFKMKG